MSAEADLARLLATQSFPVLYREPYYRQFLFDALFREGAPASAGPEYVERIVGSLQGGFDRLSDTQRRKLAEQAALHARIAMGHLESLQAVRLASANVTTLMGPRRIYRVGDSRWPNAAAPWWFDGRLLELCRTEAGARPEDRQEWLRQMLAICFDWSQCDALFEMELRPGEEIPMLEALGLPMRSYSTPDRYTKPEHLPWREGMDRDHYWSMISTTLPGGKKQLVLPFIPTQRTRQLSFI